MTGDQIRITETLLDLEREVVRQKDSAVGHNLFLSLSDRPTNKATTNEVKAVSREDLQSIRVGKLRMDLDTMRCCPQCGPSMR
jgi:hypothetical protein